MRAFWTMLMAGAVVALAPRLCAVERLQNAIEAVVQDSVVTFSEVQVMSMGARELLEQQYRGQSELFERKYAEARDANRAQLMERKLILEDFKRLFSEPEQLAFANQEIGKDVDRDIEAEIHARYGGNRMALIRTLQAEGLTLERHRQQVRERIIIGWLRQQNVSSEIIVSPYKVERYYQAHREEFGLPEEVKLRMIVLKCSAERGVAQTKELAENVLSALKKGATFVEMATINSEGSQRSAGGDLGWYDVPGTNKFRGGRGHQLTLYLADTAASLQTGQHSGVLSRSAGDDFWVCQYSNGVATVAWHYAADAVLKKEKMVERRVLESAASVTNLPPPIEFYLMLVEDRHPARFKTLAEVREKIEQDLLANEQNRLEKQWVEKLKNKTFHRTF